MHEIAIVGGGLSGLALAVGLLELGKDVHVYEARDRLGGRILTKSVAEPGAAADLGPSWFWPETQPNLAALITDLGLETFLQHDSGAVLHLTDPEQGATIAGKDPIHNGAHRVVGGMGALVKALADRLGEERITLGAVLESVEDRGDHLVLCHQTSEGRHLAVADHVVLAMPPRLLAERISFSPKMPEPVLQAMGACPTWMASEAKAVAHYATATWREAGQSGSAFVAHERAVLAETFDQGGPDETSAALGGFLALDLRTRREFATGLPMLVENQLAQLFGATNALEKLSIHDWAEESFTCSALDRTEPARSERQAAHPLLRRCHWNGRLHFAGAETARRHPGHMAGALEAADRVLARLSDEPVPIQKADLVQWLTHQGDHAFSSYQDALTRLLRHQFPREVTRIATLESMGGLFDAALDRVGITETCGSGTPDARSAMIQEVKPALHDTLHRLIGRIIGFNRSSCALRNFPTEHALPDDYIRVILQDASTLGRGFLNDMDAVLDAQVGEA